MNTIFSEINPSGEIHLGNYVGSVSQWVSLQESHECFYCIADYHTISHSYKPAKLRSRILEMAAGLIACGVDPDRAHLFVQSHVPEHTELMWILAGVTPVDELNRLPQFQARTKKDPENVQAALLQNPVLMAANILLYKAEKVFIGEELKENLELVCQIARNFKSRFEYDFPEPEAMLSPIGRIKGLDGKEKLSKGQGNSIGISDDEEKIRLKITEALTEPARPDEKEPGDPEICNLFPLIKFFLPEDERSRLEKLCRKSEGPCSECKKPLADAIVERFAPFRKRYEEMISDTEGLSRILERGARECRKAAAATLDEVRKSIGVR